MSQLDRQRMVDIGRNAMRKWDTARSRATPPGELCEIGRDLRVAAARLLEVIAEIDSSLDTSYDSVE